MPRRSKGRRLKETEAIKRGCLFCAEMYMRCIGIKNPVRYRMCPYRVCPYHELDKYDSYEEYLQSPDSGLRFLTIGKTPK